MKAKKEIVNPSPQICRTPDYERSRDPNFPVLRVFGHYRIWPGLQVESKHACRKDTAEYMG